jgi:3-isopropylmalate dehydrogenase
MGSRLENAVAEIIKEGKVRTYDMGGKNTTIDMANEIVNKL